jgi:hypothetical protein
VVAAPRWRTRRRRRGAGVCGRMAPRHHVNPRLSTPGWPATGRAGREFLMYVTRPAEIAVADVPRGVGEPRAWGPIRIEERSSAGSRGGRAEAHFSSWAQSASGVSGGRRNRPDWCGAICPLARSSRPRCPDRRSACAPTPREVERSRSIRVATTSLSPHGPPVMAGRERARRWCRLRSASHLAAAERVRLRQPTITGIAIGTTSSGVPSQA